MDILTVRACRSVSSGIEDFFQKFFRNRISGIVPNRTPLPDEKVQYLRCNCRSCAFLWIFFKIHSLMKDGLAWTHGATVAAADTPLTSGHFRLFFSHLKHEARANRHTSFTTNTLALNHPGGIHQIGRASCRERV